MTETDNLPRKIGRYDIKRLLGAGAMGSVYLAEDPRIKRKLAIKVVKLDALRNENDRSDFLVRFQREAEVSGVLNDPGIVTIYDVGDSEVGPFLAMEFVAGKPLDAYIKSGEMLAMELGAKLRIAAGVAAALDHAHSPGIVHRDVKPANVMITEDGRPKLMDFGIAKREDASLTQTGTFLGTPSYASPEQIKEGHATTRSDVFSFGVMVFEMLSGTLPFPGTSINTILYRIVNEPPLEIKPPVLGLLPESWQRIFSRALAKNADDRYANCALFVRDLLEAATELPKDVRMEIMGLLKLTGPAAPPILTRAHEETLYLPPSKARKGRGMRLALGAVALVALGTGGYFVFLKGGTVTLRVEPAAKIFQGDREIGPTGIAHALKAGETVTIRRAGFEPLEFTYRGGDRAPRLELKPRITEETLRTQPEGATVVMDGQPLEGVTPLHMKAWDQSKRHDLTFTHAREGKTLLTQFLEGEAPGNQVYQLVSPSEAASTGETKTVDANSPGFLKVTGEVSVHVRLDGRELGEAGAASKLSLPPGTHKMELSNPKVFFKEARTVTVQPGQPCPVSLPGLASITVETFPTSGTVVIDGLPTSVESDGGTSIRVVKGPHTVSIQGRGGSHSVDVRGDQAVKFRI